MSDIDTAAADSLKVLDPERPIREADMLCRALKTSLMTHSGFGPHDGADGSRSHAARAFGSFAGHVDSPQHPTISFG